MEMETFMFVFVALCLGAIIGYLMARLSNNQQKSMIDQLKMESRMEQQRSAQLSADLQSINNELKNEREKAQDIKMNYASLRTSFEHLQGDLKKQHEESEKLREKFAVEFKNLANEIFEEKSKKFTDQNKSNLDTLLKPLGEKLKQFESRVEQNNIESIKWNSELKTELGHLKNLNQQITKEAENLTKALKGDSKLQGNWGEMQLENILEKVGLQKDVHYYKEKNLKTEEGTNQRLDYIIRLPDNKYLILDSKVSLTAYSNYFEQEDEELRKRYLRQHMDSINGHIKLLGDKNYQNLYEIEQPDFVLMFVANEPALTLALREDQTIYEKALDKNIVLVSTSTLLATLRTVSYIWKQDLQNKNALEIARQAGALYDKFEGFTADMIKIGNSLQQTRTSYDAAMNKLSQGTGNLVRRTENLRELGAKTSKQLDQRLLDRSE